MSQKSSVPQAISFVSQVLKRDSESLCAVCDIADGAAAMIAERHDIPKQAVHARAP
jgi:hypothetical protein